MDSGVGIAIITASVSLAIAIGNAGFTAYREHQVREADRAARLEDREVSARKELDRVREPLLQAALDLANRLDNIRHDYFLDSYLETPQSHRAHIARTSTLYRFAVYWCIAESLYDNVALLQLRKEQATRPVADMLGEIGRTFASDKHDGGSFMMWREEQRAIAEKMRTDNNPSGCIGYATFVERYEDSFAEWFASFDRDLETTAAARSERFELLQQKLARLAKQLDSENAYLDRYERLIT